jgi:hypothetical protein
MIHVPSANRTNDLRQHAYTHAEAAARFRQLEGAFSHSLSAPVPANHGRGYSERFKTPEEAQKFIDTALRAQRIYRNLQDGVLGN